MAMTKMEFLKKLANALSDLESDEKEKFLSYYREIIEDRIENGLREIDAVAEMESIPVITERILSDVSTIEPPKTKHHPLTFAFVFISFPLWGAINVALLITICLFLCGGVVSCLSFFAFILKEQAVAFMFLGVGLMGLGFGVFMLMAFITLSKSIKLVLQNIDHKLFNRKGMIK